MTGKEEDLETVPPPGVSYLFLNTSSELMYSPPTTSSTCLLFIDAISLRRDHPQDSETSYITAIDILIWLAPAQAIAVTIVENGKRRHVSTHCDQSVSY